MKKALSILLFTALSFCMLHATAWAEQAELVDGPPVPEGFVAADNIGGTPVAPGEAFLAAGPNNVEEANIEYRLFYALTADAPDDPTSAAEYEFGTTAGDGDANGPFGFVITGLESGTEYNFYLYQYDTSTEMFSAEPAVATTQTGGSGGGGEPIGDEFIFNGDFNDGLENWSPFIADFAGVTASVEVVDGEAAITNIEGAGGEVWHIQFNQVFNDAQTEGLEPGATYKVTFDARAGVDDRQLKLYFGEEGGGFTPLHEADFSLTTSMESYEATFVVGQTFPVMKLGFEMGLSNEDVFIDNVSMMKTEDGGGVVPPTPGGFVASNMLGDEPLGSGQIFLSAGPNNVAEPNLEYRLFYSLTSEAPDDPTTATQYQFGANTGDGGATGPFGFILADLQPGTSYSFWLYQYNTQDDTYSMPAEASAISGGQSGGQNPPPTPAGLIAEDNVGGAPVDSGEIFLAVGPNNVNEENIEYRMFYSPTADAPEDPANATEYTFGSTPGDGDGIDAFGFVLSGLEAETDYTFWLYQYDTETELLSEGSASASAVTGGEGGGGEPVGDDIIFNGDFEDGLDSWTPFIADFAGVSASVEVVDGEAAITNIEGAGGEVWHIQLNQILIFDQIEALETGETYTVEFDARSTADGRQLKLYFGENEGGFVPVHEAEFNLSTAMDSYETTFEVSQTFGNMKLGFEVGLSNDDVIIDNVSMVQTEGNGGGQAPPTPAGFIAEDNVGGTPVNSGEAFLAAGPNNVEEEDIEYRLFFAPTADAPGDPTTASEYEFGTTAGDGDGNDSFGFVIANLQPGTDYTFWLYQYNNVDEVFSVEPAVASTVTGGEGGEPPSDQLTLPITFDDPDVNYGLVDFGGNVSEIVTDPTDESNSVVQTTKTAGSETWAGTTVGEPDGFAEPIPFEPGSTFMSVRVWSPLANVPVRLKVEDATNPDISVEAELVTSVTEEWETLVFDFTNEAEGTSEINFDSDYTKASLFFNFGTPGTDETYFWDDLEMSDPTTNAGEGITDVPVEFELGQNYPNPFNPSTQIQFAVPENADVRLDVYNVMGQRVATLVNESMSAGTHTVSFDARNLASGMYLYRLQAGSTVITRKMTLLK